MIYSWESLHEMLKNTLEPPQERADLPDIIIDCACGKSYHRDWLVDGNTCPHCGRKFRFVPPSGAPVIKPPEPTLVKELTDYVYRDVGDVDTRLVLPSGRRVPIRVGDVIAADGAGNVYVNGVPIERSTDGKIAYKRTVTPPPSPERVDINVDSIYVEDVASDGTPASRILDVLCCHVAERWQRFPGQRACASRRRKT